MTLYVLLCKHPASDFEKSSNEKRRGKEMAANKYAGTQTEKNLQEGICRGITGKK